MTTMASELKKLFAAARDIAEREIDLRDERAALRDTATAAGFDWSQMKALAKAQIEDERDGGRRVQRLLEKADAATAYADMLGLAKVNENNFSAPPHDPVTGEIAAPELAAPSNVVPIAPPPEAAPVRVANAAPPDPVPAEFPDIPPQLRRAGRRKETANA